MFQRPRMNCPAMIEGIHSELPALVVSTDQVVPHVTPLVIITALARVGTVFLDVLYPHLLMFRSSLG